MTEGGARIRAAFAGAGRPLFMPYVLGGYPGPAAGAEVLAAAAAHADLIELGVPFSDPLADGPTIQAAGQRAIEGGTRLEDVIELAAAHRDGPPIVLMTYVNLVLAMGPRAFAERAARAGVAGVIIPDLPIDEGAELREQARRAGISVVPLAAPTTGDARLAEIGRQADGFVYCVAMTGVTGRDVEVGEELRGFLRRARERIEAPLAVGFGVRTPRHVAEIGRLADGVIVGSELIRLIDAAPDAAAASAAVARFCEEAVAALSDPAGVPGP
ncbi:tryptophan synthase subunit alpha [Miltoncostaea marina]|uniref:tryptophan synthase subunit alpha n=1 Tax=Miltoncostaea marina TaxID=2843215 RepID=UPI001C3CAC6B|nr:tryptophan synthase subunit alpha [Miltoncostaea marina]